MKKIMGVRCMKKRAFLLMFVLLSGFGITAFAVFYGDVDGNEMRNAADVTWIRRYIAAPNRADFRAQNPGFIVENADVNGDEVVNQSDVDLLRRYLTATDPSTVRLGGNPPLIAITFDDGPTFLGGCPWGTDRNNPGYTERLLNILRDLNNRPSVLSGDLAPIYITFYVDGDGLSFNHNESFLVERMVNEGHAVDNHTWAHPRLNQASGTTARQQIMRVENDLILPFAGQSSFSFRPPYFEHNPAPYPAGMVGLDRDLNKPFIFAGIDPDDWRDNHSPAAMAEFILDGRRPRGTLCNCIQFGCSLEGARMPDGSWYVGARGNNGRGADGGNVLFHDGGGHSRERTLAAFLLIVPVLEELGYEMVTVEEMYRRKGIQPCWYYGQRVNDWAAPCTHNPPCHEVQRLKNRDGSYFLERFN
jgi:peptidoglycan/xylan/chitin deacetylase (PgdA/CDA1 family)